MEYAVGAGLGLGVAAFATLVGFDRDRAFYPAMLVVIASYYELFGVMGGETAALYAETAVFGAFLAATVIGFRTNLWIVAVALIGHGLFDLVHGELIANAGVPGWWPMFCLSFDIVAGGYLAWLLVSKRIAARKHPASAEPKPAKTDTAVLVARARTATGVFLALALTGGALMSAGPSTAQPPGSAAHDSYRIAYRVLGSGKPVVVMISGLGDGKETFEKAAREIAKSATVIIYDRSGYGRSGVADTARDAAGAEQELTRLLEQTGITGPYVLVGHSLGGLFAEYYAARHPDQVAGLILEESRPANFARRCEAAGLPMCTPLPSMVRNASRGEQDEVLALPATEAQVEAAGAVAGKPVLVLSRPTGAKPFDAVWAAGQADLAARYPGATHLIAKGGGHYIHRDQRAWFAAAVQDFLDRLK
jgi:pimeloyl-ACP methyl ester carboxylesterase